MSYYRSEIALIDRGQSVALGSKGNSTLQRRLLFFSHEGIGLGHISRIAKLAKWLSRDHNCLVVTSQREAATLLPSDVDFVKIPSFDHCFEERARFRGLCNPSFLHHPSPLQMLKELACEIEQNFCPDAIFIDHIPAGTRGYLDLVVRQSLCPKILTLRPVLGDVESSLSHIFANDGHHMLEDHYSAIFVFAEREYSAIQSELYAYPSLKRMLHFLGTLDIKLDERDIADIRRSRGIPKGGKWVICSCGSGSAFTNDWTGVLELGRTVLKEVWFDFVLGPRNSGYQTELGSIEPRIKIHRNVDELQRYHAAADAIITHGGSNSISEAAVNSVPILLLPSASTRPNRKEVKKYFELLRGTVDISRLPKDQRGQSQMILEALDRGAKTLAQGLSQFGNRKPLCDRLNAHLNRVINSN